MQQELINSTSDEYKKQLEGELVTIEEKIIGAVSTIENYEKGIQQIESLLRQQDVEKENCRRKGEEIMCTCIQISCKLVDISDSCIS